MPAFNLGLVDGDDWDAAQVDLVEAAINNRVPISSQGVGAFIAAFNALTTVCSLVVPAKVLPGVIDVTADLRTDFTVAGDVWTVKIKDGATTIGTRTMTGVLLANVSLRARVATVAGVANTINLTIQRASGTGNVQVFAEPGDANRLTAIWVPT